ncbi:MAG: FMN-binding protein [Burkholderiales bacterium]
MSLDLRWLASAAAVFSATTPQCIAAQYMTIEQARGMIFGQAQEFVASPITLTPEQIQRIEAASGIRTRTPQQQIWQAKAGGKLLGWFIVDQVVGKHELITYGVGINADGSVRQFQVIDYREAYGYQIRDLKWRDQFVGKTINDPLAVGTDIANISGGTMSSRHVTDGIKRLLHLHQLVLRGG